MNHSKPLRAMTSLIGLTVLFSLFLLLVVVHQATPQVVACKGLNLPCWLDKKGGGDGQETKDYYTTIGAIRPDGSEDTFTEFKARNGFATGADARAIYYNAGDLNLGRDMNCKQVGVNIACYVSNYGPSPFNPGPNPPEGPNPAWPNPNQALNEAISGQVLPFATVAMEFSPFLTEVNVTVNESDVDVDTHIDIGPGDSVILQASGQIWAGVLFTGTNGPNGWANIDNDPKFPLPGSHPYALIGRLGNSGYVYIGENNQVTSPGQEATRLFLRTNDDAPGNGTGAFQVHIKVERANNVKFYVYNADGSVLLRKAALDSEGGKFVPHICLACHGGNYDNSTNTIKGASFLPFDVFSFQYSQTAGWTQPDQEEAFRRLNALVKATTPNPTNPHNPIVTLINGMYPGGVDNPGSIASNAYVPPGWSLHPDLYNDFVKPFCRTCHTTFNNLIDFTEYSQFQSQAGSLRGDLCINYIMPQAQVPFEKFWNTLFSPFVSQKLHVLGITCINTAPGPQPPQLTVNNVLIPLGDPGLFNLQIDGVTRATDVGNGGTTGPQIVSVGIHTVGATAGTGTKPADYTTIISGDCAPTGSLTLAGGDTKTCVVTHNLTARAGCLRSCVVDRDACMASVGTPGGPLPRECATQFTNCQRRCPR